MSKCTMTDGENNADNLKENTFYFDLQFTEKTIDRYGRTEIVTLTLKLRMRSSFLYVFFDPRTTFTEFYLPALQLVLIAMWRL